MGKHVEKLIWMINNLPSLQSENFYSDPFVIGGCKWRLLAIAQGKKLEYVCLYLGVAYPQSLPCGWRRYVKYRLTIVNQNSEELSVQKETKRWFGENSPNWGSPAMLSFAKLNAKDGGFLVNGELMVVAEVDVREVIGKLDVSEETSTMKEDVNGFQVLPSQVESVRRIFERHPDFASEVRAKNQHLRTAYMNVLLGLIETLCQSPQELFDDDLYDASAALSYMEKAGFKLDWLEKKLNEVRDKKDCVDSAEARLQEMEEALQFLNRRCSSQKRTVAFSEAMLPILKAQLERLKLQCSDMEALVKMEKADVSSANVSLSFDDVV